VDSLRISSLDEEESQSYNQAGKNKIYDSLKQTSKVTADTSGTNKANPLPDPRKGDTLGVKVKGQAEGSQLRKLLNELHSDEEQ
jgi:hypothetical protein